MPFSYGELQAEMDLINRAYIDVMMAGDSSGRAFTFPIPTYNITKDFDWTSPNAEALFEMTARYGLPYFQNFVNSDLEPHMVRSMCCRLQLDLRELLKRGNGLFGSAEQTGSVGVVTVNCARLGHLHAGDEAALLARLDELLELGKQSLEIKRKLIQRLIDQGLFPYTRRYLGTLRNHFSDAGRERPQRDGAQLQRRRLRHHRPARPRAGGAAARPRARAHGAVPGRNRPPLQPGGHAGRRHHLPLRQGRQEALPRHPAGRHGRSSRTTPTRSQLPVGFTDDPFEALQRQDELQRKYTGGTVLHLYMNEPLSSAAACRELVKRALSRFRLPYITVTPTFSICPTHGYLGGQHEFCPKCDEERLAKKKRLAAACSTAHTDPQRRRRPA